MSSSSDAPRRFKYIVAVVVPVFTAPQYLLLAPLAPLLVWWWLRRQPAALRYSDVRLLTGLPRGRSPFVRPVLAMLRMLALLSLVVALAGPRWPDERTRQPTPAIAVALVLDISSSMGNQDFFWDGKLVTRLEAAQKAFRLFVTGGKLPDEKTLPGRGDDLIALIVFSTHPETACPLTLDHAVLLATLDRQKAKLVAPETTTNTGDAIAWAVHQLNQSPVRRKVMIFLSDGEHNVQPPALKPRQAAQLAGNLGIPIYAIDANPPDGEQSAESAKARENLQQIAAITSGKYFQADDLPSLYNACGDIDRLERDPNPSLHYRHYYEGYRWFALAGLALWCGILLLEATVWRITP